MRKRKPLTDEQKEKQKQNLKRWRKANPDKVKIQQQNTLEDRKLWYKQNKNSVKDKALQRRYGITFDQYMEMLDKTGGKCPLCDNEFDFATSTTGPASNACPVVDHDHKTGKVRGIICGFCNCGLGSFKDNVSALIKAAAYLS